ncbi:MAG TPA: hypothetical protein PKI11_00990 [Candidatus Hydrogenedentes bacterium]|nr:hypothetical protein [Candidatus Hydrogenedentota bacterium]HNT86847.1 hypothetical protein [Candidatus Hydrogenedentota bacterium]
MRRLIRLALYSAVPALIALGAFVLGGSDTPLPADGEIAATPASPSMPGVETGPAVQAYVDEAGNLVAPPAGALPKKPGVTRSFSRFTMEQTDRGGVLVNFNDGWQNAAIAHVGPDGKVHVECVPVGDAAPGTAEGEE